MSASEGARRRDEAIARVQANANATWMKTALYVIASIAESRQEFTTDAVWTVMERDYPGVQTHEPRAMGAAMNAARRAGIIEGIEGRSSRSVRPECHRRPLAVWSSLVKA